jgi:hypothetical protein
LPKKEVVLIPVKIEIKRSVPQLRDFKKKGGDNWQVIRQAGASLSFLLFLLVKGYILFLLGGYCLIYSLLEEIIKSTKRTLDKS